MPVSDMFSALSGDVKAMLLGLINTTANNIKANPTPQNVVAQGSLLLLSAPALLPSLEKDGILAAITALQTSANAALAPSIPPTAA